MAPNNLRMIIKTLLLVSLLLLIPLSSSGTVEGFQESFKYPFYSLVKHDNRMITRKLLLDVMDYDDAGPNNKHDPRKKPPAGHP